MSHFHYYSNTMVHYLARNTFLLEFLLIFNWLLRLFFCDHKVPLCFYFE